jgi:hypothetical protein
MTYSIALRSDASNALNSLQECYYYNTANPIEMLKDTMAKVYKDGGRYIDVFNGYDYDEDGCRYESVAMVWLGFDSVEVLDAVAVLDKIECDAESHAVRLVCDASKVQAWGLSDWYSV